jgi:sulfur carrier protein
MAIRINGAAHDLPDGIDLMALLRAVGVDPARAGIAVAIDGTVVRRADWSATRVRHGASVDVVTAMQGG